MKRREFLELNSAAIAAAGLSSIGMQTAVTADEAPTLAEAGKPAPRTLKIACLGDSITEASSLKQRGLDKTWSYPAQLQGMLDAFVENKGSRVRFEVRNFGVGSHTLMKGTTRSYWNSGQFRAAIAYEADLYIVMLGTNDTGKQWWGRRDRIEPDYEALIGTLREIKSKPVVWPCLISPCLLPPAQDDLKVQTVNTVIQRVAKRQNARIIDFYSVFHDESKLHLFRRDGFHPNRYGHTVMADTVATKVVKHLDEIINRSIRDKNQRTGTDNP